MRANHLRIRSALTGSRSDVPTGFARPLPRSLVAGGIGLVVLTVCMLTVRQGDVGRVEESIFNSINGLPDVLKTPMWVLQIFGSLAFVALAVLGAFVARRTRLGMALAMAIPLKLAMEWWVVKALVERERPFLSVADATIREVNSSPLGFPSGHAIFAFAVAGLLAPYTSKRGKVLLYSLALLTGLARIYLGAHNPLDVVAGAAVGVAIAAGINLTVGTPAQLN